MSRPVDYKQYDSRWGSHNYSAKGESKNIKSSGCGVTCAAMVIASLKDKSVTPVTTAKWSMLHGYKAFNQGTYYTYFVPQMAKYGIKCTQLNNSNLYGTSTSEAHTRAKKALKNGNWIIACMGAGNWTSAGHFILLYKLKNGKVYVNDPASSASYRAVNSWGLFAKQVKYMWEIEVPQTKKTVTKKKKSETKTTKTNTKKAASKGFKPYEIVVTAKSGINVRAKGSIDAKKVGALVTGTKQVILAENTDKTWGKIGQNRWICLEYTRRV